MVTLRLFIFSIELFFMASSEMETEFYCQQRLLWHKTGKQLPFPSRGFFYNICFFSESIMLNPIQCVIKFCYCLHNRNQLNKEKNMAPSVFLSYSRRETPFVNQLCDILEDEGIHLWLDYKSLVPAEPWAQQIEHGLVTSDVCVLVVSTESLASKYVELEWKRALELGKRVVLAIFQAVPLPPELQNCEWVDLRTQFKKNAHQLIHILTHPQPPAAPPPQSGFRAAWQVWGVFLLSGLLALLSIPAWWTLIIPYVVAPLPLQAYRRRFNFNLVQFALVLTPFFLMLSGVMFEASFHEYLEPGAGTLEEPIMSMGFFAVLLVFGLLVLLNTPAWNRWARPEATRASFANPLDPKIARPRPVRFTIEHAVEDGKFAEDLQAVLQRFGHQLAAAGEQPEAALVLVSAHNTTTTFNPDTQRVYPIILQAVNQIDPVLQRIQWIDMRRGLRNADKLAQLLPEPARLLKALAVAPTGTQSVYPLPIALGLLFLLVSGVLTGGSILVSLLEIMLRGVEYGFDEWMGGLALVNLLNGGMLLLTVYLSARALDQRKGGAAAVYPFLVLFLIQFINLGVPIALTETQQELTAISYDGGGFALVFAFLIFLMGGAICALVALLRWGDVRRWLPRRPNGGLSQLEKILLFYTPAKPLAMGVHLGFHAMLLLLLLMVNFSLDVTDAARGEVAWMILPVLALMVPLNLWGQRLNRQN